MHDLPEANHVVDEEGRPEPPSNANESETLLGFLDFLRATFEWKTRGLSTQQLHQQMDHASTMTLGGMMKHLAIVEDLWFTTVAAQDAWPQVWDEINADYGGEWEWASAAHDSADELSALWRGSVDRSRGVVSRPLSHDSAQALATTHPAWEGQPDVSLRWILTHMVEEYGRHSGHADLLREAIDGQTGE